MNKPLISVIMPCYNAEVFLESTIANVFRQTYSNIELIIVDDGSTDSSPNLLCDYAKKHPTLTVLEQINSGPYIARNLALQYAKGEFIAFLDADDYWMPDCLEKLYQALIKANADLSYCGWQNVVENGEDGPQYVPPAYEQGNLHEDFLKGCPWPIHAALTRRSIVNKLEGFSTRRFSAMDYDFWIRLSALTQQIVRVPEVLAFYRWHHHGQISSVKWRQVFDAWQVRKNFCSEYPELISHLSNEKIYNLINSPVSKQAYDAFWKRDLVSAQNLFRLMFKFKIWQVKDLKYIVSSLLPYILFKRLCDSLDQ